MCRGPRELHVTKRGKPLWISNRRQVCESCVCEFVVIIESGGE